MKEETSRLYDFKEGDRIETTDEFCNPDVGLRPQYHSGYVKKMLPSLPNCEYGSMIVFISEQTGRAVELHENNLQLYTGKRRRNNDEVTSTTLKDIL